MRRILTDQCLESVRIIIIMIVILIFFAKFQLKFAKHISTNKPTSITTTRYSNLCSITHQNSINHTGLLMPVSNQVQKKNFKEVPH